MVRILFINMEGLWFIKNLSLKNILKFKSKRWYGHETFILVKKSCSLIWKVGDLSKFIIEKYFKI